MLQSDIIAFKNIINIRHGSGSLGPLVSSDPMMIFLFFKCSVITWFGRINLHSNDLFSVEYFEAQSNVVQKCKLLGNFVKSLPLDMIFTRPKFQLGYGIMESVF